MAGDEEGKETEEKGREGGKDFGWIGLGFTFVGSRVYIAKG